MTKTLEDAFNGLLTYWNVRPSGGTRAELLQMAVANGFVEPLLNEWLDSFLMGFVSMGFIARPEYNLLAAKVEAAGLAAARVAATAVFEYLSGTGRPLHLIRNQNLAVTLQEQITDLNDLLSRGATFRAAVVSQFPANAARDAGLKLFDAAVESRTRLRDVLVARRAELL
jgi:hypothetical protein